MERIGQLLLAEGLITSEQLDAALRHQIVHGGRLGTNLVELRSIHLDALGEALSRQHQLPPALESHFDGRDTDLAAQVPPEVAARWHVVPLYLSGEVAERVVVASTDPLPADALRELSTVFGVPIVNGIAPELRVLYWLERVYGIERTNRFRRVGRAPSADDFSSSSDAERRHFVRTLSDAEEPPAPPSQLARIAVRQIAVPISGEIDMPPDPGDLSAVIAAIRRATGRSRIGHLVVSALRDGFSGKLDAGVIFTVREDTALGWKGFARNRPPEVVEALAVPLAEDGVLRAPYSAGQVLAGPVREPSVLDGRLWRLFGAVPAEVGVVPIRVGGEVVALLYVQTATELSAADAGALAELAQAVSAAFDRLVRAAQR